MELLPPIPDERLIESYAETLIPGRAAARARRVEQGPDDELRSRLDASDLERLSKITVEARAREWAEGRRALLEARAALGASGAGSFSSLSHTESAGAGVALALAVFPRDGAAVGGIGIDLENARRAFSPAAQERVILPEEQGFGLGFLAAWTIKEACYKAGAQPTNSTITQYRILSWDPVSRLGEAFGPGGVVRFAQFESRGWMIAIAAAPRP